MTTYEDAIQTLTRAFHQLKELGEPSLVMKVGALIGHVKAARNEAIRNATFGKNV